MNKFKDTKTFKIIIMAMIIITICSFCFSGKVKAKDSSYGGKLLNPVVDLIVYAGDGVMNILHKYIYHQNATTINIERGSGIFDTLKTIAVGIGVAIGIVALTFFTAGIGTAILGAGAITVSATAIIVTAAGGGVASALYYSSNNLPDDLKLPVYMVTPEEIFANKINLFDVDFFNPNDDYTVKDVNGNKIYKEDNEGNKTAEPVILESTAKILQGVVSNWYTILRDIAVVALLSVLVYTGIRILISLTSNDKAKYKQMLVDWIVAMCLLFFMQYIMSFSNIIVDKITDVVKINQNEQFYVPCVDDENKKIEEGLRKEGIINDSNVNDYIGEKNGKRFLMWPTNLMGQIRVDAQMAKTKNASYAGHAIMFIVLVFYTVYFTFTYLKRVLYMAFLTMIAPLVALTYPIDKMNDGKAQAFNMWFKEYIFNLLIQPLHLIIYTILVSSAFELASENVIYSLVALGFMLPAEKLMRKFFGFEKAQTPGLLAGPAGAAMVMTGMNKMFGLGPKGKDKSSNGSSSSDSTANSKPPRVREDFKEEEALFGGPNNQSLGAGGSNNQPLGAGGSNNQPLGAGGQNNQPLGVGGQNSQPAGSGGQNSQPAGSGGSNNPPIRMVRQNKNSNKRTLKNKAKGMGKAMGNALMGFGRATKASTKYYARATANDFRRKAKQLPSKIHPIRTVGKLATGAAVASATGMVGLAAGISSGDVTKTAQYTAGAMFGGYKAGTGSYNTINAPTEISDEMKEAAEKAYYGSEQAYKQHEQEKYERDFKRNEKNLAKLEAKYGRKEAKRIMKEDISDLLNNGIYDMKDITAIEDSIKDPNTNIRDLNEAITIRNGYRERMSTSTSKMNEKKKQEWRDTFKAEFDKKYPGQDTARMAENLFSKIEAYDKIRDKKD